jgi:hypothetical protein
MNRPLLKSEKFSPIEQMDGNRSYRQALFYGQTESFPPNYAAPCCLLK